jgi:hypothetical protein
LRERASKCSVTKAVRTAVPADTGVADGHETQSERRRPIRQIITRLDVDKADDEGGAPRRKRMRQSLKAHQEIETLDEEVLRGSAEPEPKRRKLVTVKIPDKLLSSSVSGWRKSISHVLEQSHGGRNAAA